MDLSNWIMVAAVVSFTLVGAVWDYRTKKLPNWLTVPAFAAAIVFHLVNGAVNDGWSGMASGLGFALGGFAVGFGILLVLWLVGGGGAGDVKLMGAVGAWLGAQNTLYVFLVSTGLVAMASIITITLHAMNSGMFKTKTRFFSKETRKNETVEAAKLRRRLMPYGVPVALATWAVLAWHSVKLIN